MYIKIQILKFKHASLQDKQLAGVIGGSGGLYIIPAVAQVFINYFILGMDPSTAVQSPRVYHKVLPNFLVSFKIFGFQFF